MRNLKTTDAGKNFTSIMLSTVIPTVSGYLLLGLNEDIPSLFSAIISAIVALIAFAINYEILPRIKWFRPFKKYEGRWLQIIPNSPRPLSIVNFKYKKWEQEYELSGFNFTPNCETGVEFVAHKFIKRDHYAGFYYITDYTWEQKNGLGKIGFISNNIDGLTRAEGYFFDASNDSCSKRYDTILIKCDKKFFRFVDPALCDAEFKKFPEKTVAEMSLDFVQKEINKYKLLHNDTQKSLLDKVENETENKTCKHIRGEGNFNVYDD